MRPAGAPLRCKQVTPMAMAPTSSASSPQFELDSSEPPNWTGDVTCRGRREQGYYGAFSASTAKTRTISNVAATGSYSNTAMASRGASRTALRAAERHTEGRREWRGPWAKGRRGGGQRRQPHKQRNGHARGTRHSHG